MYVPLLDMSLTLANISFHFSLGAFRDNMAVSFLLTLLLKGEQPPDDDDTIDDDQDETNDTNNGRFGAVECDPDDRETRAYKFVYYVTLQVKSSALPYRVPRETHIQVIRTAGPLKIDVTLQVIHSF
jgi:hypothetical protein